MDIYFTMFGHSNKAVLPLRFGVSILEKRQQFCNLENYKFDSEGTNRQRPDEIDRGRKHYTGTLVIPSAEPYGENIELSGRWVIQASRIEGQKPSLVTALREDLGDFRGDITVTKHLEEMLKRNRVSTAEIITYMHPAYLNGSIKNSNDLEDILANEITPNRDQPPALPPQDGGIIDVPPPEVPQQPDDEDDRGPLTFEPLEMKANIKYQYVWADAFILDVGLNEKKLWVRVINSKGDEQILESFDIRDHLIAHHEYAFKYLQSRKGQRAFFAICVSNPYNGTLAESVTSIALELIRSS
jgi:hypothetical protein